jgi:hypothetical protein
MGELMKIEMTPQMFRKMLSDLNKSHPYVVEGSPEDYLKDSLKILASALEQIQRRAPRMSSKYFIPNHFKLEVDVNDPA